MTARASPRVTSRLGLLLLCGILLCSSLNSVGALLNRVSSTRPEAGLGSASLATTAAATASNTLPPTPQQQLARQAKGQQRAGRVNERSESMPQAQRRVKDPQHGEAEARMRVLGVLVVVVMVPLVVVVETARSMWKN